MYALNSYRLLPDSRKNALIDRHILGNRKPTGRDYINHIGFICPLITNILFAVDVDAPHHHQRKLERRMRYEDFLSQPARGETDAMGRTYTRLELITYKYPDRLARLFAEALLHAYGVVDDI